MLAEDDKCKRPPTEAASCICADSSSGVCCWHKNGGRGPRLRGPLTFNQKLQSALRRVGVGVAVAVVMVGGAALGARNRRCDDRQSEKGGESIGKYLHGDLQWLQRVSHSWRLKVQNRPLRPFLKVSFGSRRQDPLPSGLEGGAGGLQKLGRGEHRGGARER